MNKLDEAVLFLDKANVLPSEMARESRQLYEWVHLAKSIELLKLKKIDLAKLYIEKSREWPINLGIGKPYNPDQSIQNMLTKFLNKELTNDELITKLKISKYNKSDYRSKLVNNIVKAVK